MSATDLLDRPFATLPEVIREHAREQPLRPALIEADRRLSYGALDVLMDEVASALQMSGVKGGDVVATCAASSIEHVAALLGALRAGAVLAPLAASATAESLAAMLADSSASVLFLDAAADATLALRARNLRIPCVALDGSQVGARFADWREPGGSPTPVPVTPEQAFNIIYSSGTTGTPKGIELSHRMRWTQTCARGYDRPVTMISTPLYSNTTLVSLLPTLARGGAAVLLPKFDAGLFLQLSEKHRATNAMLVPEQYRRLLEHPEFDSFDLSSYRLKLAAGAPFPAALKAEVLRRWPGGLVEIYGMTEGGAYCTLHAHEHPDKLHTVGCPMQGHDVRIIDDEGREVPMGGDGEIVGRSPTLMMTGYRNRADVTSAAEWISPEGHRYLRSGDIGRLDEDGFLTLVDRKKDMIISGGFNIYPSDIEAELVRHPAVVEAAVIGAPSERWGETPVGFVVPRPGASLDVESLIAWANARLGKTQRLAHLQVVEALPRNHVGKVLKRELRDALPGHALGRP